MASNISSQFRSRIQNAYGALSWCARITKKNGDILNFTSCDVDLEIAGEVYVGSAGIDPYSGKREASLKSQMQDLEGIFIPRQDHPIATLNLPALQGFDRSSMLNLEYEGAEVLIFIIDRYNPPTDLNQSVPDFMVVSRGFVGEVEVNDLGFKLSVNGIQSLLDKNIGGKTSKICSARFGNEYCQFVPRQETFTVEAVGSANAVFRVAFTQPDQFWQYGYCEFLSGSNDGAKLSIMNHYRENAIISTVRIDLFEPARFPIQVGDSVRLTEGCNKTFKACRKKGNTDNFQGYKDLPIDQTILAPDFVTG